jgi:27-O-demethylrifamycin SV methyltransferase
MNARTNEANVRVADGGHVFRNALGAADEFDPALHYDRVMPAWRLLMGHNLHYGYFNQPAEDLDAATDNLTRRMGEHAQLRRGVQVLDVGCGDGQSSCDLAEHFGCQVTGISNATEGVESARQTARERRLSDRVAFFCADGMDNGLDDGSFDRVWILQSSHFMLNKARLLAECVRVLKPGGRLVLGDIILRIDLSPIEAIKRRHQFLLLHRVFGRARMETLETYTRLAEQAGLAIDVVEDVSVPTLPTFDRWRQNAAFHEKAVIALVGERLLTDFIDASYVLESLWNDGRFGYGLLAGTRK